MSFFVSSQDLVNSLSRFLLSFYQYVKLQSYSEVSPIVLFRLHNLLIENRVEKEENPIIKYNTFDGLETDRQFVLPQSLVVADVITNVSNSVDTANAHFVDEDVDEF
jgi:hypothetical protein